MCQGVRKCDRLRRNPPGRRPERAAFQLLNDSDSRVPRVAGFRRRGAEAFAEALERIGDCFANDVFHNLVAELPWHAEAERRDGNALSLPAKLLAMFPEPGATDSRCSVSALAI